jgi:hypothetical protein
VHSRISRFAPGVIVAVLAVEHLPDMGKELATKEAELSAIAVRTLFMSCAATALTTTGERRLGALTSISAGPRRKSIPALSPEKCQAI